MRLCDAPIGLFLFEDTLCLMTEYSSEGCGRHAYIVSSGEMFWGGAKSKEERANLEVTPVEVRPDGLRPKGRWVPGYPVTCSSCGHSAETLYEDCNIYQAICTPYRSYCGADMRGGGEDG